MPLSSNDDTLPSSPPKISALKAAIAVAHVQIQSSITSTTKLMASLPDYCPETSAYFDRIHDPSTFVCGAGISIADMKDAHALNSVVSRMFAPTILSVDHHIELATPAVDR